MANTLTRAECEALTQRAIGIIGKTGADEVDALFRAAGEIGLVQIGGDTDNCVIFESPLGRLVNCWMGGAPEEYIGDDGMGFDDQVEWWTDAES